MVIERPFHVQSFWGFVGSFPAFTLGKCTKQQDGLLITKTMLVINFNIPFALSSDCCLSGWDPEASPVPYLAGAEGTSSLGQHVTTRCVCCVCCVACFHVIPEANPGELTQHLSVPISWIQGSIWVSVPNRTQVPGRWRTSLHLSLLPGFPSPWYWGWVRQGRVPTAGSTLKYFMCTPEILAQSSFNCILRFFFSIALCDA